MISLLIALIIIPNRIPMFKFIPNVTGLRFMPIGTFADATFADGTSSTTGYRVYFTLKIK
ncbi:MAG: hypothetical protein ACJARD_001422 [Alphaproteobacteria bacterium]|jgi:hypothetical protein